LETASSALPTVPNQDAALRSTLEEARRTGMLADGLHAPRSPHIGRRVDHHQDHDGHRNAPGLRGIVGVTGTQEAATLLVISLPPPLGRFASKQT